MGTVVIYSQHRSDPFWRYVAANLRRFGRGVVVADQMNRGDVNSQLRFYDHICSKEGERFAARELGDALCQDIIKRCRLLRCLDPQLAVSMLGSMWMSMEEIVEREKPECGFSVCLDRYSNDILARICERHGAPFIEITSSILSGEVIFLRRGRGLETGRRLTEQQVAKGIQAMVDPYFAPAYVKNEKNFTYAKFLKVFAYFEARGAFFNLLRYLRHDPLNYHYMDSLKWLDHKIGYRDLGQFSYFKDSWKTVFYQTPFEKRMFLGLQLYPEASMDYWITSLDLLDYYEATVRMAREFSRAGYVIFVKDHPLQFGFRQTRLLRRLSEIPNVHFVPYGVAGRYLVNESAVTGTMTGTIGFEAAMLGRQAVVADGGFYYQPGEFISYDSARSIDALPAKAAAQSASGAAIEERRYKLVRHLLEIGTPGEFELTTSRFSEDAAKGARIVRLAAAFEESYDGVMESARRLMAAAAAPRVTCARARFGTERDVEDGSPRVDAASREY